MLKIAIDGHEVILCNVYGPNTDSPEFYENMQTHINDMQCEDIVWCGDFNLVLNPNLDCYNYKCINNPKARDKILELIETYSYIDPFRQLHEKLRRYSWRKKSPLKQGRLDFFLLSESLLSSLDTCYIESSYRSDHSAISLSLTFNDFKKGHGLWKFNNSLLYDDKYLECIRDIILKVKKQYAVPVYNMDNLHMVSDENIFFTINDQLFLETLLFEIRGKSISYSSYIKKKKNKEEQDLMKEIKVIEENASEGNVDELYNKKQELEKLRKHRLQGNYIRSRAKWVEEGEKPSSYFCKLESRNFTSKIIPQLELGNGDKIYDQSQILIETKNFYENLYKCNLNSVDFDLENELSCDTCSIPKLSEIESESLEGEITFTEASNTLLKMKSNKSPGSDGFSAEFFKVFWKYIGVYVVRSINHGYKNNILSITQRHGVITLLPKGDKPKQYLKNWRPITLLNTVYKIASGSIAARFKKIFR